MLETRPFQTLSSQMPSSPLSGARKRKPGLSYPHSRLTPSPENAKIFLLCCYTLERAAIQCNPTASLLLQATKWTERKAPQEQWGWAAQAPRSQPTPLSPVIRGLPPPLPGALAGYDLNWPFLGAAPSPKPPPRSTVGHGELQPTDPRLSEAHVLALGPCQGLQHLVGKEHVFTFPLIE